MRLAGIVFLVFFFVGGLQVVFSISSVSCCYDGHLYENSQCRPGDLEVNKVSVNNLVSGVSICNDEKVYCKLPDNECVWQKDGLNIYDYKQILAKPEFSDCIGFYHDNLCKQQFATYTGSNSGNTQSSSNGDVTGKVNTNQNIDISQAVVVHKQELQKTCSQAGGQFGFFVSKDSCESITGCLYNPVYGGLFSTSFSNKINLKYGSFENNSCIAKSEITVCSDYKTKDNCNEDAALSFLQSNGGDYSELAKGCTWVDSKNYDPSFDMGSSGMCISNVTGQSKYYNLEKYSFRLNLIKNPSFEDLSSSSWGGYDSSKLKYSQNSFHGLHYYELGNSGISQKIGGLKTGLDYSSSLYVLGKKFDAADKIVLKIVGYNYSNPDVQINPQVTSISLSSLNSLSGDFDERVDLGNYQVKKGTDYVVFELKSVGSTVPIDAVSFEVSGSQPTLVSTKFKPVEIISSKASYCNLCYSGIDFNTCTKKKSDLLGDCSYMVSGVDKPYESQVKDYLGSLNNSYIKDANKWTSQSLANSKLFCEMYTNKAQCIDPNNYVNSKYTYLHPLSGTTLCKWNDAYGCFKDSNNDSFPDVIDGKVDLFSNSAGFKTYGSDIAVYYNKSSDFALACDMLPPDAYVYFHAVNRSLDSLLIVNSSHKDEVLGNVNIKVDAFDYPDSLLESCNGYNVNNFLIFDYSVNGESGYLAKSNLYDSGFEDIKSFFRNTTSTLVKDGMNNIVLRVLDSSGNVGKVWHFLLNLDISGPNISLISPSYKLGMPTVGKGADFNFSISDYSKVKNCSYTLKGINSNSNDYTPEGVFNLSNVIGVNAGNHNPFIYSFKLPINKTNSNFDWFDLNVTCSDIFNQNTSEDYLFMADYNTDMVLVSPKPYFNSTINSGFLNSSSNKLNFASTDKNLVDCNLVYEDGTSVDYDIGKGIYDNVGPFKLPNYKQDFYTNITMGINLVKPGINKMTASCEDNDHNVHNEKISYFYDPFKPKLNSYSVLNTVADGRNSTVKIGDKYYFNGDFNSLQLGLNINGTSSCIGGISNMSVWNSSGLVKGVSPVKFTLKDLDKVNIDSGVYSSLFIGNHEDVERTCNISNSESNFVLSNFQNKVVYVGLVDKSNYGLSYLNYSMDFFDMAGNKGTGDVGFYYDSLKPAFDFSGDVVSQDGADLYTKESNPLIKVDFKTPSYRKYSCSVLAKWGKTGQSIKSFVSSANILEFKLKDVSSGITLSQTDNSVALTFMCSDNYGVLPSRTFTLNYDNTAPILDKVAFKSPLLFGSNNDNPLYDEMNDTLMFFLENTNEKGYFCKYQLMPDNNYDCNTSWQNMSVFDTLIKNVDMELVSGGSALDGYNLNPNALCKRNGNFAENLQSSDGHLETKIGVKAVCQDMVGLLTEQKSTTVNINYISGEFTSFDFKYVDGKAYPVVKSLSAYPSVLISRQRDGKEVLMELDNPVFDKAEGVYVYTSSSSGIDMSKFTAQGLNEVWAVAMQDGQVIDTVHGNLMVDNTAPQVSLIIPDEDNGNVYSSEFELKLKAYDFNDLSKVELYLNGDNKIFSYDLHNGNVSFDNNSILGPLDGWNYCYDNTCDGSLNFINAKVGDVYDLVLRVYDANGNVNESEVKVTVKDGVGIRLLNSATAKVDVGRHFWVTKSDAPEISFITSKKVDFCVVQPMIDKQWEEITKDSHVSSKSVRLGAGTNFSVNLGSNEFTGFDLSKKADSSAGINISCMYNGSLYSYTRDLKLINFLPDYVLTSSNGFVFNENPYSTKVTVESVGPYRYLDYCNYTLNGVKHKFVQKSSAYFTSDIDLSSVGNGKVDLGLVCVDMVGNRGPKKSYEFVINKSAQLEISDVELSSVNATYIPQVVDGKDTIYVGSNSNLNLRFKLNKKNGVSCTYFTNSQGSALDWFVNFFRSLFSVGREKIENPDKAYEFEKLGGVSFSSDGSNLIINCNMGSESASKTYVVKYLSTEVNVSDLGRVGLN